MCSYNIFRAESSRLKYIFNSTHNLTIYFFEKYNFDFWIWEY